MQSWKPAPKCVIESDEAILKSVAQQKWRGVTIKNFGEEKGKGKKIT